MSGDDQTEHLELLTKFNGLSLMLSLNWVSKTMTMMIYRKCPRGCKQLLGDLQGDKSKVLLYQCIVIYRLLKEMGNVRATLLT
jgi:hypothetical protein